MKPIEYSDLKWMESQPILTRIIFRMFRRRINSVIAHIISAAYERGHISSEQMHSVVGIVNRRLFFEYTAPRCEFYSTIAGSNTITNQQCRLPSGHSGNHQF